MSKYLGALTALILTACEADLEKVTRPIAVVTSPKEVTDAASSTRLMTAEVLTDEALRDVNFKEFTPEEQEVRDLLRILDTKLKINYAETGWGSKGKRLFIQSPTGKKLAVSIQGNGWLVNINPDSKFRYSEAPEAILQIVPEELLEENFGKSKRPHHEHTDIQHIFNGNGYAPGDDDMKEVFKAFGLPPETSSIEKLKVILVALNEQL